MPARDFFSFCTTLKPLELKALGELSYIRHVEQGTVLYSTGQPSDTLFIINRGTVELLAEVTSDAVAGRFLRGDVVGGVELLTATPRGKTARAAESLSMRCFHREDFPELTRRAPSFFVFLSEHFAWRLQHLADEAPPAPKEEKTLELAGSLANFDLVTIYQTIVIAAQTGELRINNEKSDLIAAFEFESGQPRSGHYDHLTGEDALLQLFLRDSLSGTFLFNSRDGEATAVSPPPQITRQAGDLLIWAVQGRDELHHYKARIGADATVHRRKLNFDWPENAPPELQPIAEEIWQFAYSTPTPLSAFYHRGAVCELKIYEIIDTLVQSGHFELRNTVADSSQEKVA